MKKARKNEMMWRIQESVHLGLDSIFMSFGNMQEAMEVFNFAKETFFRDFEIIGVPVPRKSTRYRLKLYITEKAVDIFGKKDFVPLPENWFQTSNLWENMGVVCA